MRKIWNKIRISNVVSVLLMAAMVISMLSGMRVSAEDMEKATYPVTVNGNTLSVQYNGKEHTVSGFTADALPEGVELVYDGGKNPSLTESAPGTYTKDLDADKFDVEGENAERFDWQITTTPLKLTISEAEHSSDHEAGTSSESNAEHEETKVVTDAPNVFVRAFTGVRNLARKILRAPSASGSWYEDWTYTLDETDKKIKISKYNGSETVYTVPATASIDGTTYTTELAKYTHSQSGGAEYFDTGTISTLDFEEGVLLPNDSDRLFSGRRGLISLDVSHFDTSNVTNMGYMFYNCSKITSLNVSNFDTSNVKDITLYFIEPAVPVKITVKKVLEGKALHGGEFTFQLIGTEGGVYYTSPDGTKHGKVTAVNEADGTVAFDTVYFFDRGTYTLGVKEIVPDDPDPRISYDDDVKDVVVTVPATAKPSVGAVFDYGY